MSCHAVLVLMHYVVSCCGLLCRCDASIFMMLLCDVLCCGVLSCVLLRSAFLCHSALGCVAGLARTQTNKSLTKSHDHPNDLNR
jgi:hypothetical protein